MSKAILIQVDDWEGLFIDGKLIKEGHTLNEGTNRIKYFSNLAKEFNFYLEDLQEVWIDDRDAEALYDIGSFPEYLSFLVGDYEDRED